MKALNREQICCVFENGVYRRDRLDTRFSSTAGDVTKELITESIRKRRWICLVVWFVLCAWAIGKWALVLILYQATGYFERSTTWVLDYSRAMLPDEIAPSGGRH